MARDVDILIEARNHVYEYLNRLRIEVDVGITFTNRGDIIVHLRGISSTDRRYLYDLYGVCGKTDDDGIYMYLRDFIGYEYLKLCHGRELYTLSYYGRVYDPRKCHRLLGDKINERKILNFTREFDLYG